MRKSITASVTLLTVLSLALACSQSGEEAVKQTENDVLAIHDEVMPKLDDIVTLRKQLRQRLAPSDSTAKSGSASATLRTDEEREQAQRLVRDLTVADSLMFNWMNRYNGDTLVKLSSDDALRYLAEQKEQVIDVKTKINTSIEQARQFLGKK